MKKPSIISFVLSALICSGLPAARGEPAVESLTLAANGVAAYKIYVGSNQDVIELYAAQELAKYLGQISGASFEPLAQEANPTAAGSLLIVGRNNATGKLSPDIPYDKLGDDGFVIRTAGPHIVIAGATPRGTLYGVYWLLDRHLGVRWFSPAYTFVPTAKTLAVKKLQELQVARFDYRELFAKDGDDPAYRAHNLLNGRGAGHRTKLQAPPGVDSWSTKWGDENHNFFKVAGDKKLRADTQLAAMNPATRDAAVAYFIERAGKKKPGELEYLGFHQQDGSQWKMDPESQKFADAHGGVASAPMLDMVMEVAKRTREKFPDAKFNTSAYTFGFLPPTGMTIPDYIQMTVAPIFTDYSEPFQKGRLDTRGTNVGEVIAKWAKISRNIVIWDYAATNFHGYVHPHPTLDSQFESIQWLATMPSVKGYFGQASMASKGANFGMLRQWVGARVLWDPKQDWRALVEEFVKGYYGDAAPYISEYVKLLHEAKRKSNTPLRHWEPVTAGHLPFETMRQADGLFDKAEKAVAGKDHFPFHVKTERMGVDLVMLLRCRQFVLDAKKAGIVWNPEVEMRLQRLTDSAAAAQVTAYGEIGGKWADKLIALRNNIEVMNTEHEATPSELVKGLPASAWREFLDLDFTSPPKARARTVIDPQACNGAAVTLPGSGAVQGILLSMRKLPQNSKWKIHASVRVELAEGARDVKALTIGYGDAPANQRDILCSELMDGKFHTFELPGICIGQGGEGAAVHEKEEFFWCLPPKSKGVKAIYVDRVVAVWLSP